MATYRVLLVDDEKDILMLVANAMRKYGIFKVDDFSDPIEALEHFKKNANDYSIVVSDMRMPGMTGIELLRETKRIRPNIPVVAMTAYDDFDKEIVHNVPSMTKEQIVHKPFALLSVCDAVKKTLNIQA